MLKEEMEKTEKKDNESSESSRDFSDYGMSNSNKPGKRLFFILKFKDTKNPKESITYPKASPAIQALYKQGRKIGKILGLECVGDINESIQQGRSRELILLR